MGAVQAGIAISIILLGSGTLVACGSTGVEETGRNSQRARAVVEEANLGGIHSGEVEVVVGIEGQAGKERFEGRISGTFIGVGKEVPPRFDLSIESSGKLEGRDVEFFTAVANFGSRSLVFFGRDTYQPSKATFDDLKAKLRRAQRTGDQGNVSACKEAADSIEIPKLVENFSNEGRHKGADGKTVLWIGGDLNAPRTIDALSKMTQDGACSAQLEAVSTLPVAELEKNKAAAAESIDDGRIRFEIDSKKVLRGVWVEAAVEQPGGTTHQISLRYQLSRVNEVTELPNPGPGAPFPLFLKQFGLAPSDLHTAGGGELLASFLTTLGNELTGR